MRTKLELALGAAYLAKSEHLTPQLYIIVTQVEVVQKVQ